MGTYQYQRRVQRLKQSGVEVHEFGNRVLKESCYGGLGFTCGRPKVLAKSALQCACKQRAAASQQDCCTSLQ